jgi:hypothetical protein
MVLMLKAAINRLSIASVFLLIVWHTTAADIAWTNGASGIVTNENSWVGGVVPTAGDNAVFTTKVATVATWDSMSTTNANAFFNATNPTLGRVTLTNGTWWVTNSMIIGQNAGSSSLVSIAESMTLILTNANGTGTLQVGGDGRGGFFLNGGTLIADHIYATNSTANFSAFTNRYGTMITYGDSVITNLVNFQIGTVAAQQGEWDIYGGTVKVRGLEIGTAGTGVVVIAGSSTYVSNSGILRLGTGSSGGALLVVSNGATLFSGGADLGIGSGGTNIVLISDSGTVWTNSATVDMGDSGGGSGSGNQIIISNGGRFVGTSFNVGRVGSTSNLLLVTDPGSLFTNTSNLRVANDSSMNQMLVTNGGVVAAGNLNIGDNDTSQSNQVTVTGAGSQIRIAGTVNVGSNGTIFGSGNVLILDNGLLQARTIDMGFDGSGIISNRGGTLEFITAAPTITTNTLNSIILTNATLSFVRTNAVDINQANLAKITFEGENSFQLNNSTSILFSSYFFGLNNNTNFQHLKMTDTSRWQATNTIFQSGGLFTLSNTTATIFGITTNMTGSTMKIVSSNGFSSTATFEQDLVINGTGDGNGVIQNTRATNTISAPIILAGNSTISSASGKLTIAGAVTNQGHTLTVGGAGNVTLAAQMSGAGGLAINGGGTVTISNTSANTFTGATTVTNSTVRLSKAGALASTSGITLSASGTLLMDGGSIDRIGNTVGIRMDGGSINLNDLSETAGTLTMESNSTIVFNFNSSAGDLTFANGTYNAGTLTINGWFQANEGGEDKLYFTNDPGSSFLNNITFTGYAAGARRLSTGEIVPSSVPEPGTVAASLFLSLFALARFVLKRRC